MVLYTIILQLVLDCFFSNNSIHAQSAMINIQARHSKSLNGKWQVIVDPTDIGNWREIWKEKKPGKKTDFVEYAFEGGPVFDVPGDFNTQMPELTFYEGTVWYKKTFTYQPIKNKRLFLHFGAVNYKADVYMNGNKLGSHEGGFTPFQFEITDKVLQSENTIIVRVNNQRLKNGIPGLGYDWLNYGGITRDVNLVETSHAFIEDYSLQLKKLSFNEVLGWVKMNGNALSQKISVKIPELGIDYRTITNNEGTAEIKFIADFKLWSPEKPKLYKVILESETDTLIDKIGFRSIEVQGTKIVLNGKSIFLKGINIHEENPLKAARAFSEDDAILLLTLAKELGCNFVRLAHYPHNEHMIKEAERMGLMVWEELPVYQHIEFAAPGISDKMNLMLHEMIKRDKNRCGIVIWGLSNETYSFTPSRDNALINLTKQCRLLDSTRLLTSVICTQGYENNTFDVWDTLYRYCDFMSVNEYIGWYTPWQGQPKDVKWKFVCNNKPLIISEFGGEALYGSNCGPKDEAAYWSEEYQEQIYKNQIEMFGTTPNLSGVCPWLLVDYRSLSRLHPLYQKGWNRKGLLSHQGDKKKAWYVLKKYYESIRNEY